MMAALLGYSVIGLVGLIGLILTLLDRRRQARARPACLRPPTAALLTTPEQSVAHVHWRGLMMKNAAKLEALRRPLSTGEVLARVAALEVRSKGALEALQAETHENFTELHRRLNAHMNSLPRDAESFHGGRHRFARS
ncbi:MAG: hypothetical protein U0984_07585 [Prosthecobacter sp.]|nr:hypothetical protein [Prosthecobacter sp.]